MQSQLQVPGPLNHQEKLFSKTQVEPKTLKLHQMLKRRQSGLTLEAVAGGPIHGLIKIATDHRLGIPSQCFAAAKAGIGETLQLP